MPKTLHRRKGYVLILLTIAIAIAMAMAMANVQNYLASFFAY